MFALHITARTVQVGFFTGACLCCTLEQGFITVLGDPSPVQADVKEGESLSLRAEFDAYPEPSDLSWSYDGKRLLNTTEHVITVHRRKYRYVPQDGSQRAYSTCMSCWGFSLKLKRCLKQVHQ